MKWFKGNKSGSSQAQSQAQAQADDPEALSRRSSRTTGPSLRSSSRGRGGSGSSVDGLERRARPVGAGSYTNSYTNSYASSKQPPGKASRKKSTSSATSNHTSTTTATSTTTTTNPNNHRGPPPVSELDRILSTPRQTRAKATLDDVLQRGRAPPALGGGRSVASRKSIKSTRSRSRNGRAVARKQASNPQGGSDENTSANSDTLTASMTTATTASTSPPKRSRSRGAINTTSRRSGRSRSPSRRGRSKSRSRAKSTAPSSSSSSSYATQSTQSIPSIPTPSDQQHIEHEILDSTNQRRGESFLPSNLVTNTNNNRPSNRMASSSVVSTPTYANNNNSNAAPFRTPKATKSKLKLSLTPKTLSPPDQSVLLSPAEQKLKKQIEQIKRHVSPKYEDTDHTDDDDDDDVFQSPKAMATVSQDVDDIGDASDKESYFRQRIQHYQSEFFAMQVQLTEAQAQITKLMELRKKDKGRLEDAADKFLELKSAAKQSKTEVKHLNDRIYELEDTVVRCQTDNDKLRETVEQKLDKIDELERNAEDEHDQIRRTDLAAWEAELKGKEERLSAESTFDSLKGKQLEEREDDIRAREKQLEANEMLMRQKMRHLDERDTSTQRQQKAMKDMQHCNSDDTDIVQKMRKEINEKDFQLEKASKAFTKMAKKHEESVLKAKQGLTQQLQDKEKELQSVQRNLKHEQRMVEQLKSRGTNHNNNNNNDDETIAELKLELAKMEDELNANDPVGYASKLKTEVMLLKEQNRVLKTQMDNETEETHSKLQKKDETIAYMQNELVKIKMNGNSIAGVAMPTTGDGDPTGSMSSYSSPTTVVEGQAPFESGTFSNMINGMKRSVRKR